MHRTWPILDMDEGVLRGEQTRAAAVVWMTEHEGGGRVLRRHDYGPGQYEYHIGTSGEDSAGYFVERIDQAVAVGGWADWVTIPDKYPFADRPHDEDPNVDRDALIKRLLRGAPHAVGAAP